VLSRRGASEPGRLRLRLSLEKAARISDGAGGATLDWSEVAIVPAEVTPLRGDERAVGEGVGDMTRHRIAIRKRGDVAASDRFRLGARIFDVKSVSDPAEDGRYLVCLCDEEGRP
jgi:SPP1 family predicted phage head-tail adaptor